MSKQSRVGVGGKVFVSAKMEEFLLPSKREIIVNNFCLAKKHLLFPGSRILEFGCLSGIFTGLVNKETSSKGVGVDVCLISKSKDLVLYDGKKLPFRSGSFDSFVAFEVLEHLDDALGSLKELNRVLKVGGKGLVSTPNKLMVSSFSSGHNSLVNCVKCLFGVRRDCVRLYSFFGLVGLFREAGFSCELLGGKPFFVKRGFFFLVRKERVV